MFYNRRIFWHPSIKKNDYESGVLNRYTNKTLEGMKILARPKTIEVPTQEEGVMKEKSVFEYAVFDNHVDLYKYIISIPEEKRIFHEYILSGVQQKLRFDIDLEIGKVPDGRELQEYGSELRERLLCNIENFFLENKFEFAPEKNFLVYSSHRPDKYSSHILIDGYYAHCSQSALGVYLKTTTQDKELEMFVDKAIYDKNHPLRLMLCKKKIGYSSKTLETSFQHNGKLCVHSPKQYTGRVRDFKIFERSLVTFTAGSKALPDFSPPKPVRIEHEVPDEAYELAIALMREKIPTEIFDPVGYQGNLISLKRLEHSLCVICNIVHELRDSILLIYGDRVYWNCCRTEKEKKSHYVGKIKLPEVQFATRDSLLNRMVAKLEDNVDTDQYKRFLDTVSAKEETIQEKKVTTKKIAKKAVVDLDDIDCPVIEQKKDLIKEDKVAPEILVKKKNICRPRITKATRTLVIPDLEEEVVPKKIRRLRPVASKRQETKQLLEQASTQSWKKKK